MTLILAATQTEEVMTETEHKEVDQLSAA